MTECNVEKCIYNKDGSCEVTITIADEFCMTVTYPEEGDRK